MATTSPKIHLSGLARRLVQDGLITEETIEEVNTEAAKKKKTLVSYLVENKILESGEIASAASQEFGVPLFDLSAIDLESAPIQLVEEKLITKHHALPLFKRGNRLFVAVSDPTNLQALDEIKFHTGINTEAILVEEDKLTATIEQALQTADTSMGDLDDDLDNLSVEGGEDVS